MSKDLKKYLNMYGIGWMCLTIIVGGLLVGSVISMIIRQDFMWVPQLIMLVIVLLSLIPLVRSQRFFKALQADPALPAVEEDFKRAFSMRKDRIRFGDTWIFYKRAGRLLRYDEIKQVYQYIHRTNFVEDERALKCVDGKGKHRKVCKLELREKSNEELAQMISIILSKNPDVKVGYR